MKGNGRDAAGRFAPGNPGGPGRPRRETEAAYLEATIGSVSIDDWRTIVERAVEDAKGGDHRAREWLSKHLLPSKAGSPGDVDRADVPINIMEVLCDRMGWDPPQRVKSTR